jgi:hypothetical protein
MMNESLSERKYGIMHMANGKSENIIKYEK